ncbi:MAG: putative DNA binding domain-containing protein [Streptococcaceae bacterium]|nr:putative DNA binding domain-containing protein [Streptococcaceae bacterium]
MTNIIAQLKREGNDNRWYEVKKGERGFPESIIETFCAFANTPGGGTIIVGLDEDHFFESVKIYNTKDCMQRLANLGRNLFTQVVELEPEIININHFQLIVCEVTEMHKTLKPVKIKKNKKAYIRQYDGDYTLSSLEEQQFIAERGHQTFDETEIEKSDLKDLDSKLVKEYLATVRRNSTILKNLSDEDVLYRTGVITRKQKLTFAGAFALGIYPQQFFPNYSIQCYVKDRNARAINSRNFSGPIPTMIDDVISWVKNNMKTEIIEDGTGHLINKEQFPLLAIRELVANSLIHRDLNPITMIQAIHLVIQNDKLTLTNPGGLYGITVDELGTIPSKTRNLTLSTICQNIKTTTDKRVVEKLGTGIPNVLNEVKRNRMETPKFIDSGLQFTVILDSQPTEATLVDLTKNEKTIYLLLRKETLSRSDLEKLSGLTARQVRYALDNLLDNHIIKREGAPTSKNVNYRIR